MSKNDQNIKQTTNERSATDAIQAISWIVKCSVIDLNCTMCICKDEGDNGVVATVVIDFVYLI